ncbi:hypothetical protein V1286_001589 [Bradyrhizobium algeriense]|uniref:Polysaccharide chain length determinant N-terminal domain-containing protein n=1 Tax=Bradyrhizobium algeriense TaxID=634784 RepID=A0ABU8B6G5_9BRAD
MSVSSTTVPGDHYLSGLLTFLYRTIRANIFSTVLLPLASMLIAYVAALQLPTVYTAQASIRIGRVDGGEAISLTSAVSRINSLAFKQHVVQGMNFPAAEGARPAQLIFGSLTARQDTAADTVGVSVQATTAQQARDIVAVAVALLNEEQRKIQGPLETNIKEQLATYDATISSLLETRDSLAVLTKEDAKAASGDPVLVALRRVWLSDLVSRNEQRLAAARSERNALSARLGGWRTYPTAPLDELYVSSGFAHARPATIAIIAGAVVFLIFLFRAMLRESKAARPD